MNKAVIKKNKERSGVRAVLTGLIAGVIIIFAVTLVFAFLTYHSSSPENYSLIAAVIASFLSAFAVTLISGKLYSPNPLTAALIGGAAYIVLILLSAIVFGNVNTTTYIPAASLIAGEALGTLFSVKRKKVRKFKR